MARIRYIKPEFFDDERLCSLKPLSRILFAGLWCWADREGRLEDSPQRLKKNILGYDNCQIEPLLAQLAASGHIIRYESEGRRYIQIKHFLRHQRPHAKERASTLPAPTQVVASTDPAPTQVVAEHLPDPPEREQNGNGNGEEEAERQPVPGLVLVPPRPPPLPPPRAYRACEDLLGSLTKPVIEQLDAELEDGVPDDWIVAACEEAALSNGRSWKYVQSILRRWGREGFRAGRQHAKAGAVVDDERFPASEGWQS